MFEWLETTPFGDTLTWFEILATIASLGLGGVVGGTAVALKRLRTEYRSHFRTEVLPAVVFVDTSDPDRFVERAHAWDTAIGEARVRTGAMPLVDRAAWQNIDRATPDDLDNVLQNAVDSEIQDSRSVADLMYINTYEQAHLDKIADHTALYDKYLIHRLRRGPTHLLGSARCGIKILWRRYGPRHTQANSISAALQGSIDDAIGKNDDQQALDR